MHNFTPPTQPYTDYTEMDGTSVVAVIRETAIPLVGNQHRLFPERGQIVGLATCADARDLTWLCEVLTAERDYLLEVVVKCMVGQAEAAVWYGPPTWIRDHGKPGDGGGDIGDVAPCNYDVFGVLPKDCQGPPVLVDPMYVRVCEIKMFVPPPYRRGYCWWAEKQVYEQQLVAAKKKR